MNLQRLRTIALGLLLAGTAVACMAPADAEARTRRGHHSMVEPWHGWANGGFYLNGVRHPGGNRRGPAFAYNNYEGGFNAAAFWEIMRTQSA